MHYRTIPGTPLSVSELSFGNFIFGSHMWGKTPTNAPEGGVCRTWLTTWASISLIRGTPIPTAMRSG